MVPSPVPVRFLELTVKERYSSTISLVLMPILSLQSFALGDGETFDIKIAGVDQLMEGYGVRCVDRSEEHHV